LTDRFRERLQGGSILVADGATGTSYQEMGSEIGVAPEEWVYDRPDKVLELHRAFISAGSDIILTDTFGGTPIRMRESKYASRASELNRCAAELAQAAAAGNDGVLVAGSIGPSGLLMEPYGELTHDAAVQTFADQAAIALMNARLIDAVDRQRTELARFVSPQVAELISSTEGERLLAGHRAYITCLFCDLRGFTTFAETAAPEELLDVLREYHRTLGHLIHHYQGTLEHFAGDGVMVFFNDPLPVDDHELQATRLALAAQERFAELTQIWAKRGTELGLGIGIEAGYATLGRIGFPGRYDYGAVGPVTNLSSRLSTHAAAGQVLIGQRVYAAVDEAVDTTSLGSITLKGFVRPIPAYEVRALR